jgi:heptosyltransferase-2
MDRTLIVAPSWVGDAILAEPLLAMLREPYEDPTIDVLAPPWCAPVFRRMRGVRRIIEHRSRTAASGSARRRIAAERKEGYARVSSADELEVGADPFSRASRAASATRAGALVL